MGLAFHPMLYKVIGWFDDARAQDLFVPPMTPELGTIRDEGGRHKSRPPRWNSERSRYHQRGRLLVHGTTTCLIIEA
jgi:hypothetical protein